MCTLSVDFVPPPLPASLAGGGAGGVGGGGSRCTLSVGATSAAAFVHAAVISVDASAA